MQVDSLITPAEDILKTIPNRDEHEFFFHNAHLQELELLYCGYQKCAPGHRYGPTMRDHFYFHFIVSGKGIVRSDRTYTASAGSGFIGLPHQILYYEADREDPWTYAWIGAKGSIINALVEQSNVLSQYPIITDIDNDRISSIMNGLIYHAQDPSLPSYMNAVSLFFSLVACLSQSTDFLPKVQKRNNNNRTKEYVEKAKQFIQDNYFKHISMTTVANYVGIDEDYLARIFKKELNTTPLVFLCNVRLGLAHKLLLTTSMPIQEIAAAVGFSDPQYFSRCFTKSRGISPRGLRRQAKT